MNGPVVVVGAGPAGALLSIYLARNGHDVTLYERRGDLRRHDVDAGRSINLALATRGIVPLVDLDIIGAVDAITVPLRGRMIHPAGPLPSHPELQPYGSKPHEVIHSVSRSDLNRILLDAAAATGRVEMVFDAQLERVDLESHELLFADGTRKEFGVVFGADGAGSVVRSALVHQGVCCDSTEWLGHKYRELTLPPAPDGSHQLDPNALHIWPRGEFMLIALANPEGDFTATLFAPTATFDELDERPTGVAEFFDQHFGDFAQLVPDLVQQFADNPSGPLGTMRATGWSYEDRVVLVGDAAHAIVPFHGQGMNLAMESVRALVRHLVESPNDLVAAFSNYEIERKPNADAIAKMALDNYVEMRAGVVDPHYRARRSLALELEERHPRRLAPRYNMVMFSTMPYAEAQARAEAQGAIIDAALANPDVDVDAAVADLPELPANDPLADAEALSIS